MAFSGSGKIWMNGSLVDWADAKIHVASHVIHYGSAVFEGARCYATPRGSACFRLDAHMRRLYDSAKIYRMEPAIDARGRADRRGARDDSRQRVQGLLHPPDRLPRLRGARRQPVPLPGRHRDPDLGMGRLPGRRGDPARRRRAHQLLVARGAEHVPDAGEELGELRQLAADQDGSDRRGLQRGHRARHPRQPERRQRPEPVPRPRRRPLHAVDDGGDPVRASPATR